MPHTLAYAFEHGSDAALQCFGVRTAVQRGVGRTPIHIPPVTAPYHEGPTYGTPRTTPPSVHVTPAAVDTTPYRTTPATPPPTNPVPHTSGPHQGTPAVAPTAPAVTAARGWSPFKKTLGLAALGAGGALAMGLHRQNKEDRANRDLIYAPMTGYP